MKLLTADFGGLFLPIFFFKSVCLIIYRIFTTLRIKLS